MTWKNERICHKVLCPICSRGLNIADGNLSNADSIEITSRQEAAQIAKEAKEAKEKEFVLLGENPLLK